MKTEVIIRSTKQSIKGIENISPAVFSRVELCVLPDAVFVPVAWLEVIHIVGSFFEGMIWVVVWRKSPGWNCLMKELWTSAGFPIDCLCDDPLWVYTIVIWAASLRLEHRPTPVARCWNTYMKEHSVNLLHSGSWEYILNEGTLKVIHEKAGWTRLFQLQKIDVGLKYTKLTMNLIKMHIFYEHSLRIFSLFLPLKRISSA